MAVEPFVGEIRMWPGNFAPAGWLLCLGQLIPISENETLFNLIGTTYGGDGQSTFALPNLGSRVPVDDGQGPGQPTRLLGEIGGTENVTITIANMAAHSHGFQVSTAEGGTSNASGNYVGVAPTISIFYEDNPNPAASLNAQTIQPDGGSQPHENIQPFLCINHIISLYGVYPFQG